MPRPLDLSRWRGVPTLLMLGGGALALLGAILNVKEFAFTWLLAFMFFLSVCLGALFLVIAHHLFDASWSVPIRRISEHIASLLCPTMALLFIPIAVLAPRIYDWMHENPQTDHALRAKLPLFTWPGYYLVAAGCFLIWWILSRGLRNWSLRQDQTGSAECTYKMRLYSYWGIFAFAVTLTVAAIMWMGGLQYEWFSTMYGVYYFAGSVWMTLAMVYVITMVLARQRVLEGILHEHQFYYLGSLMFAFTVFYAYIHFAQYFIIWNANMPEETFWYVVREKGTWWWIGMVIIFGHFFIPFLSLLRIDVKSYFPYMTALAAWAWLMHYVDLSFNVLPIVSPDNFPIQWIWLHIACLAFMFGVLSKVFLAKYASAAPYPLKDPRLAEAVGHYQPVPTQISGGELDQTDSLAGGAHPSSAE